MDNTRSKSRKTKNHSKSKSQPNPDEIEDAESQLLSPVDRVRANHLATTPVTPAGNIVDMQGSLDQSPPEKIEDDKSDNKNSVAKTLDLEVKDENQEVNKEIVSNELTTENTSDCKESQNECESSSENKNPVETVEKETIECLEKENVSDCQGIIIIIIYIICDAFPKILNLKICFSPILVTSYVLFILPHR